MGYEQPTTQRSTPQEQPLSLRSRNYLLRNMPLQKNPDYAIAWMIHHALFEEVIYIPIHRGSQGIDSYRLNLGSPDAGLINFYRIPNGPNFQFVDMKQYPGYDYYTRRKYHEMKDPPEEVSSGINWERQRYDDDVNRLDEELERLQRIPKESIAELQELWRERLETTRAFQYRLAKHALDMMPGKTQIMDAFRLISSVNRIMQRQKSGGKKPEWLLDSIARARVEEKYRRLRHVDQVEIDREIQRERNLAEIFNEDDQPSIRESDPRDALKEACRLAIKELLIQSARYYGMLTKGLYIVTDEDTVRGGSLIWDYCKGNLDRLINADITYDRDKGDIQIIDKDGTPLYLSSVPIKSVVSPYTLYSFSDSITSKMSISNKEGYDFHAEVARVQLLMTIKVLRILTQAIDILEDDSYTEFSQAISDVNNLAKPYIDNLEMLFEPYLIDTTITPTNLGEIAKVMTHIELIRGGTERLSDHQIDSIIAGMDDGNPDSLERVTEYLDQQEHQLEHSERLDLTMIDSEATLRNISYSEMERRNKIRVFNIMHPEDLDEEFIERHTREVYVGSSFRQLPNNTSEQDPTIIISTDKTFDIGTYPIISIPTIVNTSPVGIRISKDGSDEVIEIPSQSIRRDTSGRYYAILPKSLMNTPNVKADFLFVESDEEVSEMRFESQRILQNINKLISRLSKIEGLERFRGLLEKVAERTEARGYFDPMDIEIVVYKSQIYPTDGSEYKIDIEKIFESLPQLIDKRTGLFRLQCSGTAELVAAILKELFRGVDGNLGVFTTEGYSLDLSTSGNSPVQASSAHRKVKIISEGKVLYLDATGTGSNYIALRDADLNIREKLSDDFGDSIQPEVTETDEEEESTPSAEPQSLENSLNDEIANQRITEARQQMIVETGKYTSELMSYLDEILESDRKLDTNQLRKKLIDGTIKRGTPYNQLIRISNDFKQGLISRHEAIIRLIKLEELIERTLDPEIAQRVAENSQTKIGLHDFRQYPSFYIWLKAKIEELKLQIEG